LSQLGKNLRKEQMVASITHTQISAILQTAIRYQQSGQFLKAEEYCLKVCAAAPDQPDALHLLAIIYAQTKRYQAANDCFSKAITSAPKRADFLGNYGNALWEQGCIDEAVTYCQRSLALNANQAEVHNVLGNAYLAQNRAEIAAESFRKALSLRPNYPHALNNLGNALQRINKTEEAVTCYQRALELQANYPEACNNLGQALRSLGRIAEARDYFQRAILLRSDFAKAIWNYAEVDPIWLAPLDGKKLYLRRYREEDAVFLRQCYQNTTFMAQYNHYIPRHQRAEELAIKLREVHDLHPRQSKSVDWIIVKKKSNQSVGIANLVEIQFIHRRAEFLIGLPNTEDHAQGIGLEATLLVLDYAFNKVGLNKLTTAVYEDNLSSQHNTLAIGFVQESYLREQIIDPMTGNFHSIYGNGMTLNDFRHSKRISRLSKRLLGKDITLTPKSDRSIS
jgi:Tfp pilus assembly protein PilF/RimJ/RimL family protein N-acetyltransferase